ncbi:MAG: hypoxanthine phosphoribosyltransferase [Bacteroidales bacterium]|jgi:hypoxanthine phosphoribosyltransferase|nr:hypoxanthine phosphoribosyltransferase [Bacteroidales bacterium]
MNKVTLFDKTFKPYISNDKIEKAIDNVASDINKDFEGCDDIPIILCVLNGSIIFTSELMKRLKFNCQLVSIKLSSYCGTNSTGDVKQAMGLTADVKGRRIIIIEDIVDTGKTIVELENILKGHGAKEIKVCTMLLKPEALQENIKLDYVALEIENKFIVGFGLDYNEIGRNFPEIYILDESK